MCGSNRLPAFKLRDPNQVSISAKILEEYVGTYELRPDTSVAVTLDGRLLMLRAPWAPAGVVLYPESETRFFMMQGDFDLEFVKDASGTVTSFITHQSGHDLKFTRK